MKSYKMTLSYDGTEYQGWQVQPNGDTVQEQVEKALYRILGFETRVTASGRTDSGVHAIGQVMSAQFECRLSCDQLRRAINNNVPEDIQIREIVIVEDGFHAIRDARRKRYRYLIQNGELIDLFRRTYCWHIPRTLDLELMRNVSTRFIGEHDFASFQAAGSDRKTTVRKVYELVLERDEQNVITIEIEGNGFLYNMVRNIVGTLVEIGLGKHGDEIDATGWLDSVFNSLDRANAGQTAPANGLFLVRVDYD